MSQTVHIARNGFVSNRAGNAEPYRAHLERLAALLKSLNRPLTVELLPYHTMALPKWKALNMLYKLSDQPATAAQVAAVKTKLTEYGIACL